MTPKENQKKTEALQKKRSRLAESLRKENERLIQACDDIPWGAGMRRTKCTPSFRREDEIKNKIEEIDLELSKLKTNI